MEAVSSTGAREIAADDFFTGLWETLLEASEILTAVRFPVWGGRSGFAIEEVARRHGDFAIAGAAVAVQVDDDRVSRCGVGLLGLGSTPLRASAAEAAVLGRPVGDITAQDIGNLAVSGLADVPADLQGSASYRTKVGATMVARAGQPPLTKRRSKPANE
jgi:carbon-monoxide dehydrogenase medium subunit